MRKIRDVLTYHFDRNFSNRKTAEIAGMHHTSVAEYLERFHTSGLPWPLPVDMDDSTLERKLFLKSSAAAAKKVFAAPIDFAKVYEAMKKRGATLAAIHAEWLEEIPPESELGYSQFCRAYKAYLHTLEISMRRVEVYGENCYVDYSGMTIGIANAETGEIQFAQVFVGVLGGSKYTFCEATWSQKSRDWIGSHVRMFQYFGGVPYVLVPDNLKAAVTKVDRLLPVINESYKAMCRYYGIAPLPARAYKPKDKSPAEAGVFLVQRRILFPLRNRKFFSLEEANQAIRDLLEKLNNEPFQKLSGSRHSRWLEHEFSTLQPLPASTYEIAEWGKARAGIDYHVKVENHHYSVPYQLRGKEFEYRLTDNSLELIHKGTSQATHRRSHEAGCSTTIDSHRPPSHQAIQGWTEIDTRTWAAAVGKNTESFLLKKLGQVHGLNMAYRLTQSMKSLEKIHGSQRLEEACSYAQANKISKLDDLRAVLDKRLDVLLPHEQFESQAHGALHENIRGANYYDCILKSAKKALA